jgi:hypothetical protein
MPPFLERLAGYFDKVGEVLRGEAEAAAIFPNSADVGTSRERVYAEVLRSHLPSQCRVVFGGFLFDQEGRESKQLDIIVVDDSSLRFDFYNRAGEGKSFACVDGCLAVVSVKSTLTAPELVDTLENLSTLPEKLPVARRRNPMLPVGRYDDWPYKIVFAHRGSSMETIRDALLEFYRAHPDVPENRRPNLIHVAGSYYVTRVNDSEGGMTRDGETYPEGYFVGYTRGGVDRFALLQAFVEIQWIAARSRQMLTPYGDLFDALPQVPPGSSPPPQAI